MASNVPYANQGFPQGGPSFVSPQVIYNQRPQSQVSFWGNVIPAVTQLAPFLKEAVVGNPYQDALMEKAKADTKVSEAAASKTEADRLNQALSSIAGADPGQLEAIRETWAKALPQYAEQLRAVDQKQAQQYFKKMEESTALAQKQGGFGAGIPGKYGSADQRTNGDGAAPAAPQPGAAPPPPAAPPTNVQQAGPPVRANEADKKSAMPPAGVPQPGEVNTLPQPEPQPQGGPPAQGQESAPGTASVPQVPPVAQMIKNSQKSLVQRPLISPAELVMNKGKYSVSDAFPFPEAMQAYGPQITATMAELERPENRVTLQQVLRDITLSRATKDMEQGRTPELGDLLNLAVSAEQARNVFYTAGAKNGIQMPPNLRLSMMMADVVSTGGASLSAEQLQELSVFNDPHVAAANMPLITLLVKSKQDYMRVMATLKQSEDAVTVENIRRDTSIRVGRMTQETKMAEIQATNERHALDTEIARGRLGLDERKAYEDISLKREEMFQNTGNERAKTVDNLYQTRDKIMSRVLPALSEAGSGVIKRAQAQSQLVRDNAESIDATRMQLLGLDVQIARARATAELNPKGAADTLKTYETARANLERTLNDKIAQQDALIKESQRLWAQVDGNWLPTDRDGDGKISQEERDASADPRALAQLKDIEKQLDSAYTSMLPFRDPRYQEKFTNHMGFVFSNLPLMTEDQFLNFTYGNSGMTIGQLDPKRARAMYNAYVRVWNYNQKPEGKPKELPASGPAGGGKGAEDKKGAGSTTPPGKGKQGETPPALDKAESGFTNAELAFINKWQGKSWPVSKGMDPELDSLVTKGYVRIVQSPTGSGLTFVITDKGRAAMKGRK